MSPQCWTTKARALVGKRIPFRNKRSREETAWERRPWEQRLRMDWTRQEGLVLLGRRCLLLGLGRVRDGEEREGIAE